MSTSGAFLPVNGIRLYYEVHGQGEPLLLLHGGGGSADHFAQMVPELAQHFRVITPDTRAHGRSTDTADPLSYRQMVDDMVGLLDALAVPSAHVGGWSDGASIALHMALYAPERVRTLLLTPVDLSADALTDVFWEDAKQWQFPEKLIQWWRTRVAPTEEELASISAPTLILAGVNEQYIKHATFQRWSEVIPNAELRWLLDTDHALVLTKPAEVNQAIVSFVAKHQAP
jgi:pimeloyl-ACP methyl ester carboxylesterase